MILSRRGTVAVVASGALFLTGCAPSLSEGEGGEGSGEGTVKMVLWPGPEGEAMSEVVDQYNAGQGQEDGVEVEMTLLSRQDTFSKESTLMAARSSEQDIYFVASYNVGQFSASLDPLPDVDTSNYFPVAVDSLTQDGNLYALPLDVSNHFLLYRQDLIDALVQDTSRHAEYEQIAEAVIGERRAPKPADQWDWDDYKVMAAYFSTSTNPDSPTQYGTILQARNLLYNTMIWNDVLWGMGGSWTTPDGEANLDTPEAEAAVRLYSDIYANGWTSPDAAQAEFPETQAALKAGNAAFAVQWSAGFAELNDPAASPDVAGKIAIAPVPGDKTHVHALAVALNKYSQNKAAALEFLDYLATPEAMTTYAQAGGIPAMPEVLSANEDVNPAFGQIAESIDQHGYSVPVFPRTFEAYSVLAEDLSSAWVGSVEPQEALRKADEDLQSLLD
jgi:multiple sugar transport system substrate-binding protein